MLTPLFRARSETPPPKFIVEATRRTTPHPNQRDVQAWELSATSLPSGWTCQIRLRVQHTRQVRHRLLRSTWLLRKQLVMSFQTSPCLFLSRRTKSAYLGICEFCSGYYKRLCPRERSTGTASSDALTPTRECAPNGPRRNHSKIIDLM